MGEAAESDDWAVEQAVTEYEAYRAGALRSSMRATPVRGGMVQYCGAVEDESHWTVAYVRAGDQAVTPLAVGELRHVIGTLHGLDQARTRIWDEQLFPPPVALVGGARHHFQAAQGRFLVGVAKAGACVVLLAALGERLAVVHVDGKSRTVVDVKRPQSPIEVDVDRMLSFHRPPRSSRFKPATDVAVSPSPATQAHHIRIVHGVPVEVGDGPPISQVLLACFEDLARRAMSLSRRQLGGKRAGKTRIRMVLAYLYKLGLIGCGDLAGRSSEIIAEIQRYFPEFEITVEAFSDALKLLHEVDSGLVERPGEPGVEVARRRTWQIHLVGLNDPRSAQHRRLCKATAGRFRFNEAAVNLRPASAGGEDRGARARDGKRTGGASRPSEGRSAAASQASTGVAQGPVDVPRASSSTTSGPSEARPETAQTSTDERGPSDATRAGTSSERSANEDNSAAAMLASTVDARGAAGTDESAATVAGVTTTATAGAAEGRGAGGRGMMVERIVEGASPTSTAADDVSSPGSKDSKPCCVEAGTAARTADATSTPDPLAALSRFVASSQTGPMMLAAGIAVAQARLDAERAHTAERAAWEVERGALVAAGTVDRAEFLALQERVERAEARALAACETLARLQAGQAATPRAEGEVAASPGRAAVGAAVISAAASDLTLEAEREALVSATARDRAELLALQERVERAEARAPAACEAVARLKGGQAAAPTADHEVASPGRTIEAADATSEPADVVDPKDPELALDEAISQALPEAALRSEGADEVPSGPAAPWIAPGAAPPSADPVPGGVPRACVAAGYVAPDTPRRRLVLGSRMFSVAASCVAGPHLRPMRPRPNVAGLPVDNTLVVVEGHLRGAEPDWFGDDFIVCEARANLSGLAVLGSVGPRGPPRARR